MYYRVILIILLCSQVVAVFGGMGRAEPCSSTELYTPASNQWQPLPPMRLPRWGSGVAVLGNEVYIAGGSDSHSRLYSVERFDMMSLQWSAAPHMTVPRNGVGLIAHRGTYVLYICQNFHDPISYYFVNLCTLTHSIYTYRIL